MYSISIGLTGFSEFLKENHTTKEEALLSERRGKYDHSFYLSLDVLNEKRAVISIHTLLVRFILFDKNFEIMVKKAKEN